MENVTRIDSRSLLSRRWRVLLWVLVIAALTVTFLAYGQVALLIQWVSAQLC